MCARSKDWRCRAGELRATASFPSNGSVVQVGASPCNTPTGQGSCNENIGFHSMTFDGSHVASACLTISSTMGSELDSSSAVFGFVNVGILLQGGHEAMVRLLVLCDHSCGCTSVVCCILCRSLTRGWLRTSGALRSRYDSF